MASPSVRRFSVIRSVWLRPGKPVDELARELNLDPAGIVKLASNENPLGPSPKALEAIRAELAQARTTPLTDAEVGVVRQAIIDEVVATHDATLRS